MINGKRVAIDARMIESSGIGTYIQNIIKSDIYDVALGDPASIRKYNSKISVIPFNAAIYKIKEQLFFPNKELKRLGVSMIHFPHYNVPLSCSIPYVVTIHDLIHIIFPEYFRTPVHAEYAKFLMKHAIKRAEMIFVDSGNTKKDLERYFGNQIPPVNIVYCGVDERFHHLEKNEYEYLFYKLRIPKDKKRILYLGNIRPHKNVIRLINAFLKSEAKNDAVLILAGDGMIKEYGGQYEHYKEIVRFIGRVDDEDIVPLYNFANLFAFPSLYEGFGLPPLEALACGTKVICSNTSSLPEVIGNAAEMFDPYDEADIALTIDKALNDEKYRFQEMKNQVSLFRWEKCLDSIKQFLSLII